LVDFQDTLKSTVIEQTLTNALPHQQVLPRESERRSACKLAAEADTEP